jgi:DNA polymerase-3 subunit alpha
VSDQFVHLHNHLDYSILDGAAAHKSFFAEAARLGQPAIAMTDHGNLFGAHSFYRHAKDADITPIIGIEAYVAPADRTLKKPVFWGSPSQRADDVAGAGAYLHMTLLAETAEGLRNLFRLSSIATIDGAYRKPRMDRQLLAEHSAGIIATTGCPSGEIQTRLRLGQPDEALRAAAEWRDIFGPDNFFLEVMDHGLDIENRVRAGLLDLGRRLGLRPVATNDAHYVTRDQASVHDALLCVQAGAQLADTDRFRFDGDTYYLRPAAEMRALFDSQVPGACDTTLDIAGRVQPYDDVFTNRDLMAQAIIPAGHTESQWLRHLVAEALQRRGLTGGEYATRAEFELGIIDSKGYPGYFLVVADICDEMRRRGIRYNTRGSAAGSLVAYALGITNVDPLPYNILFERFLNPERPSAPDIDLDIDETRRTEMIGYVAGKYGHDRVAQIITFGIVQSRAAVKDAARVLGHPYGVGEMVSSHLPPKVMGKDVPLAKVLSGERADTQRVRDMYRDDPVVKQVVDLALGLEGARRQVGVHAAGVIIARKALLDVLPVWKRPEDGAMITGFDMNECDALGLVKMDFLGLRNLTVLGDAIAAIEDRHGVTVDLATLPLTDPRTFELLGAGETLGVFQLDGVGITSLLRLMRPTTFEDISATLALYRPGPMGVGAHTEYANRKNGSQPVKPIHPELAEPLADILDTTFGLIVYQEQVMAIVQRVAGYTLGRADLLRSAMGKKKKDVLDREHAPFCDGMRSNGYSDEAISTLWDTLLPFSSYAFNKAHTASYGMMSYWTAYLKANYPAEYMAALLTSTSGDKDKSAVYLAECRRMGIKVLPPDVNESQAEFAAAPDGIRFGLAGIRNVGGNVVDAIIQGRKTDAYKHFYDFMGKVDQVVCNKKTIESVIKAGAFDTFGHTRKGLLAVHADTVDTYLAVKRKESTGQFDLFAALDNPAAALDDPPIPPGEWDQKTLLAFEREMLGLYVSAHPLDGLETALRGNSTHTVGQVKNPDVADGTAVTVAGLLTGVNSPRTSKAGKLWASATLEDLDGSVEILLFSAAFEHLSPHLANDTVVAVKGRISRRDESTSITVADLRLLEPATANRLEIALRPDAVTGEQMALLREILARHRGTTETRIRLRRTGGPDRLLRVDQLPVTVTPSLLAELKAVAGVGNVTT